MLVYVNTLLLQRILADQPLKLTDEDRRAITPLFWSPYGSFRLRPDRHLDLDPHARTREPRARRLGRGMGDAPSLRPAPMPSLPGDGGGGRRLHRPPGSAGHRRTRGRRLQRSAERLANPSGRVTRTLVEH